MGNFQSMLNDELRRKNTGKTGVSKWIAIYGKPEVDRKLNIMIDNIEKIVGDLPIEQILVHRFNCQSCEESLPKFRMLNTILSERLPNYKGFTVELDEKIVIDGQRTNKKGIDIYKIYEKDAKGVPFVIQNAKVVNDPNEYYLEPLSDYSVVYVGKLDPFRFLATAFNVKNEWIDTSL